MKHRIIREYRISAYVLLIVFALFINSCDLIELGTWPESVDVTNGKETCDHKPPSDTADEWRLAVIDPITGCWLQDEQFANSLQDAIDCSKIENPGYELAPGIFIEFEIVDFNRLCEFWILDLDACNWVIVINLNSDYALRCVQLTTDIDGNFTDLTESVKPGACIGGVDYGVADEIQELCEGG